MIEAQEPPISERGAWIGLVVGACGLAMTVLVLARGGVLGVAACVPPMAIVPAVSNDYKLVLCVVPLSILTVVVATMKRSPAAAWAVLFGAVALLMMLLARSTIVVAPSQQASTYTLLVALQVLLLVVVPLSTQERRDPAPAAPAP